MLNQLQQIIEYPQCFPTSENLCVFLWNWSKWIVCFFGNLYYTELELQRKF